jgi:hypothetical protein
MLTRLRIFVPVAVLSAAFYVGATPAWSQEQDDEDNRQEQQQQQNQQDDDDQDHRGHHERSGRNDHSQAGLGVVIRDAENGGVEVERVVEDSPAQRAGLQQGDRILRVDGQDVDSSQALSRLITRQEPGRQVQLEIIRDGQRQTIQANLVSRQRAMPRDQRQPRMADRSQRFDGSRERQERIFEDRQDDHRMRDERYGRNADRSRFDEDVDRQNWNRGDVNARLSQLENTVNRLTRQVSQLQGQLAGRRAQEFRTRSDQDDRRDDDAHDRDDLRQDRYDSDQDDR